MARFILALDGGGSKTECVLVREDGQVCGRGRGGGVNRNFVSEASLEQAVRDALNGAMGALPDSAQIEHIAGSMSCDSATLRALAGQYHIDPSHIRWLGEALPARATSEVAYGCLPNVVVVAGTGSLVAGWFADGTQRTVGGAGATVGDEGSAYWIGVRALRRLAESFDGRRPFDAFARSLCETLAVPNLGVLINRVYGGGKRPMTRDEIATVAVPVCRLAEAGEPFAIELFQAAAHELAFQVNAIIRLLDLKQSRFHVLLYGGVFRSGNVVAEPLKQAVLEYAPEAQFLPAVKCTVIGSAALALRAIGVEPAQPDVRRRLMDGARQHDLI